MTYWYDQLAYPFRNLIIGEFIFFKDAYSWDSWTKDSKDLVEICDKIPNIEYYKKLLDNLEWEKENEW